MYEIGPFSHWTLFKGFWKYSRIFLWPLGFSPPYSSPPALCRGRVEGIASLTSPSLWLLGPASGGQETRGQSRAKWTNASPPAPAACKLFRWLASFSLHSAPIRQPSLPTEPSRSPVGVPAPSPHPSWMRGAFSPSLLPAVGSALTLLSALVLIPWLSMAFVKFCSDYTLSEPSVPYQDLPWGRGQTK